MDVTRFGVLADSQFHAFEQRRQGRVHSRQERSVMRTTTAGIRDTKLVTRYARRQ
jgi:hypothetical protein